MFDAALPVVGPNLLVILESKQPVLAISEESVSGIPSRCAVTTEFVAVLVLADENGVFVLSTAVIKGDQTAAVLVDSKYALPVIVAAVGGQLTAKLTDLVG